MAVSMVHCIIFSQLSFYCQCIIYILGAFSIIGWFIVRTGGSLTIWKVRTCKAVSSELGLASWFQVTVSFHCNVVLHWESLFKPCMSLADIQENTVHSLKSLGLLRGTKWLKRPCRWLYGLKHRDQNSTRKGSMHPQSSVSSPLLAMRIHFLMGTYSAECRAVTGAMSITPVIYKPATIQTYSISFWLSTSDSHQFKVRLC